jgi:hypothetical protein
VPFARVWKQCDFGLGPLWGRHRVAILDTTDTVTIYPFTVFTTFTTTSVNSEWCERCERSLSSRGLTEL